MYMQRQKKQAIRQAKIETKEIGKACKEHTNKESQLGGKQSMLSIWKGKQACFQTKEGVLEGQM